MKWVWLWILAVALQGGAMAADAGAVDAEAQFDAANQLTAQGKFSEGTAAYDELASGGRTSAALEYNRSQSLVKAGQLGRAWGHLLLAQRLSPRDSAIRLAVEQLASRVPSGQSSRNGPGRWLGFLTLNEWAALAGVVMWIWGGLLLVSLRAGDGDSGRRLRKLLWISGGAAALTALLLSAALYSRWRAPDTIVLRPETAVRVSPLDEARTAFSLPDAFEVRSRDTRDGWVMIEDPDSRRFGWVKGRDVQILPFR